MGRGYLEPVRLGEPALQVQLYEGLAHGSSVSQDCHHQDVTRLSRHVTDMSRHVTEMSRLSHTFVTSCHKLSQAVTTAVTLVTLSHRVSKHLSTCRHVDISQLVWGVYRASRAHLSTVGRVQSRESYTVQLYDLSTGESVL